MNKEIQDIITDLLSGGKLNAEEQEVFEHWMENEEHRSQFRQLQQLRAAIYATNKKKQVDVERSWQLFSKKMVPRRSLSRFLPYVAAVLVVGFGVFALMLESEPQADRVVSTHSLNATNQKQVVLTLSTGEQVVLSDTLSPMREQNGVTIRNTGNQLVYQPNDSNMQLVYNTVRVPRGGEYKLVLSDGSVVWINSESEITYPVSFGRHNREIKLKGEAFFEVRQDSLRHFIVQTDEFNIRVTGTQFNVRTYPNDVPSATLAQGGIQLEKGHRITCLLPGQQASIVNGLVEVREVDLEEALAWRNEAFCFKQRPLESLLNEIARWYDIEIFYQNDRIRNFHFTAWFRRSTPLNEIIEILEKTQEVKFELKGKTLMVRGK